MSYETCPFCKGEGKLRWVWRPDGTKFVPASEATIEETAPPDGSGRYPRVLNECHACLGHGLLTPEVCRQSVVHARGY